MAEKNIQMKINTGTGYDDLYPKTKIELVDGLNTELDKKVDKVPGKQLSTEDYTTEEKDKLAGIEEGANYYEHPTTPGNIHIPAGGDVGDLLKYGGSSGTAQWGKLTSDDIPTISLSKISDAGTAASRDVGTSAGNVPEILSNGKLDSSILPHIAITDTHVVESEAEMLALDVQIGDIAIRTDISKTFILQSEPASELSNWQEILSPTAGVESVNGKTGAVVLTKNDIGLSNVENYSIATQGDAEAGTATDKYMTPERTKQAIDTLSPVKSVAGKTGTVTLTKEDVGLENVENFSIASQSEAESGTANNKYMTPQRTKQAMEAFIVVSNTEPTNATFWFQEI